MSQSLRLGSYLHELPTNLISLSWHLILQRLYHHVADPLFGLHLSDFLDNNPGLSLGDLSFGLLSHMLISEEVAEARRELGCLNFLNLGAEVPALSPDDIV